ncbi:hypothetical protein KSP40_PGU022444 [Platanthera guangdongensis]|uniref:Uncharacterized protein n=1 Tax=Platanthera guangdongensis TaxID=2320717 RepID=A0ABR2MTH5_9ASPA
MSAVSSLGTASHWFERQSWAPTARFAAGASKVAAVERCSLSRFLPPREVGPPCWSKSKSGSGKQQRHWEPIGGSCEQPDSVMKPDIERHMSSGKEIGGRLHHRMERGHTPF